MNLTLTPDQRDWVETYEAQEPPITSPHQRTSTMTRYATRTDAVQAEIIAPIEATGVVKDAYAEYDIGAIQDEVLGDYEDGYALKVSTEDFWEIVQDHEL